MTVAITLLDTRTGQQTTITEDWDSIDAAEFYWEEGNGSCDCNRRVVLGEAAAAVECGDELIELVEIRASCISPTSRPARAQNGSGGSTPPAKASPKTSAPS